MTELTSRQILDAVHKALDAAARRVAGEARLRELARREGITDVESPVGLPGGVVRDRPTEGSKNGELA